MAGLVGISVHVPDFSRFAAACDIAAQRLPEELMLKLRSRSDVVIERARSDVDPYSQSVPQTIQARVQGEGIVIEAEGVMAGLLEYGNRGGSQSEFTHPVFGHMEVEVSQPMHPFLGVALEAEHDNVNEGALAALEIAIETAAHL